MLTKLPSFNAVAAGSVSSVSVPPTVEYAAIYLRLMHGASGDTPMTATNMKTLIEYVKIVHDGVVKWHLSASDLIMLNDYYGIEAQAGILPLVFARPYLNKVENERFLAMGTADIRNCTIEVKFSATVTNPVIEGWADFYKGANRPLGAFVKLEDTHYGAGGIGIREISDLPILGNMRGLKALHISTEDIGNIEIKGDRVTLHDAPLLVERTAVDRATARTLGRNPQTGYRHVDIAGNNIADAWNMRFNDFRALLQMTAATDFRIIHEVIEFPATN